VTSPLIRVVSKTCAAAVLLIASLAHAQTDPKFEYAKAEAAKAGAPPVEWKAQIKAGVLITGGNSQVQSATLGLNASRKEGNNKLSLESGVAYGKTDTLQPFAGDMTMPMVATDLRRQPVTTTNNWFAKGRYDRFFTENNAGYVSAQGAGDKIAGKTFFGGGQIGYSRQLLKTDMNTLVGELGYDFSYETYVQPPPPMASHDPVAVHSARIFAGETVKVGAATGVTASVEALLNLNKEGKALNHNTGAAGVDPLKDTRVIARATLTTNLWKALSIAFGFTLRYDQNPAPLPLATVLPAGWTLDMNAFPTTMHIPFAQTTDAQAEATLIYTFF
jgi:hypothetical protein